MPEFLNPFSGKLPDRKLTLEDHSPKYPQEESMEAQDFTQKTKKGLDLLGL